MHRAVVYDPNKRKHNLHYTFYFYTLRWWDVKIYKFSSCLFYDVKFLARIKTCHVIKIVPPLSQILLVVKHTPL